MKTSSKGGDGTYAETMDDKGPNITGKNKGGYHDRTFVSNNRTTPKVSYQYRLYQVWIGSGASSSIWLSGGKKYRGIRKRR